MENNIKNSYQFRLEKYELELIKQKKKNKIASFTRGIIFLVAIISLFFTINLHYSYIIISFIVFTIPFLYFVKQNVKIKRKIEQLIALININKNELIALSGDFSIFENGKEFINSKHSYSFDLDIFGKASVFQFINRTCTKGGKKSLADKLSNLLLSKDKIEERQTAIKELSKKLDWRQNFCSIGNLFLNKSKNNKNISDELSNWSNEKTYFENNLLYKILLILLPGISIILFVLTLLGIFPFLLFAMWGLIPLMLVGFNLKYINSFHRKITEKLKAIVKYEKLLLLIENEELNSSYLNNFKKELFTNNKISSQSLKKLKSLISALDNRLNPIFAILSNVLLLWDIQYVLRIEKWQSNYKTELPKWIKVINEYDSLLSFANMYYNNPSYIFPEINETEFNLEIIDGGHILIDKNKCITNSFNIKHKAQMSIVTGANMAGKSTFLRMLGVNLVLAMIGSPVFAKKMSLAPIKIHTSIRANDSLKDNESYFYAELKRLKEIVEEAKSSEAIFIIIDEMLRGTNSKDKHYGSVELTKNLIELEANGIIATHDVLLGDLANTYPDNINNKRFEVEIINDKLIFDYKLKKGVSVSLNASFLMKKMGIIKNDSSNFFTLLSPK